MKNPTPEFTDWFNGSRVTTPTGTPLTVYRGEHGATHDGALQTVLGNYTFTECPKVASTYALSPNDHRRHPVAEQPRVVPAFLSIKNPVFDQPDDPFVEFSDLEQKFGREFATRLAIKYDGHVTNTNNWEEVGVGYGSVEAFLDANVDGLAQLYMTAYPLLDDPEFVKAAIEAGYDGAMHIGSGESGCEMEYRVFDLSQVRSAIGNCPSFAVCIDPNDGVRITAAKNAREWVEAATRPKAMALRV